MKKSLVLATCALAFCLQEVGAATVSTTISYDTLGLAHISWLIPASATQSSSTVAQLETGDLPPIPYYGYDLYHSTYINLHAYSNIDGALNSSTGLRAGGLATGFSTWSEHFVNDTGNTQSYVMNFALGNIGLGVGGWTGDVTQRDYRAGFVANILVNGVSVWQSSQTLRQLGANISLTKSGVDIGTGQFDSQVEDNSGWISPENPSPWSGYTNYSLAAYLGSAGLGAFLAGQEFDVTYELSQFSYWNDPGGCSYECGWVSSGVGDPFAFDQFGVSIANGATGNVPEPAPLTLFGAAMLGFIVSRKRSA